MALKAVVEKLDDLDESLRAEYKEVVDPKTKEKVYVLDVEDPSKLPDVDRLNTALRKERQDHKDTKTKLAPFSAFGDPTEVQAKLDRIPELEAAAEGKLDETKINTIVESRVKQKIAPIERERDTWKTKAGEFEAANGALTAAETRRKINSAVNKAARDSKVINEAMDDVEMYGNLFEVDDHGNVVTKDNVGVTPGLDPKSWLTDMQAKRPHWWGPTLGGGGKGNLGGGGAGGVNPWGHDTWNVSQQNAIYKADPKRAEQLAVNAGTKLGGTRPVAKK